MSVNQQTITMEHSKYRIVYTPGKEWDYHVFRGEDQDVTKQVRNNVLDDVVYELINIREQMWEEALQINNRAAEAQEQRRAFGDAAVFRLRETMAADAFQFLRNTELWDRGYPGTPAPEADLKIDAAHNDERSVIRVTSKFSDSISGDFETTNQFTVCGENDVMFHAILLDEKTSQAMYDVFSGQSGVSNGKERQAALKAYCEKWSDPEWNMTREAQTILANADRFAYDFDYYDYMDSFGDVENPEDVSSLLNDVSGKECFALALYFYKAEQELPEPENAVLRGIARTLRENVATFSERWFRNPITEKALETARQRDEKEMAGRHRKYLDNEEQDR